MFERLRAKSSLTARLRVVSALRIGAGRQAAIGVSDLPVMRDLFGRPYIPGSSIKGVVRSYIESIVRTLWPADGSGKGRCNPTGPPAGWCVPNADDEKYKTNKQIDDDKLLAAHCPVCRLFGSPWIASKVSFVDAPVVPETWHGTFIVRDGVAIDRDLGIAADKKKYDFEVVPGGTEFGLNVRVENATDPEMGLLYVGISALGRGELLLGGMTSRGPGAVELVDAAWEHTRVDADPDDIVPLLLGGAATPVFEDDLKAWAEEALLLYLQEGADLCTA